jgi:excisionase family DNA binding protein
MPSLTQDNAQPARISYSVKQASHATSLSRSKLYEMMKAGALRYKNVGNRRLIPADALRELLVA